MEHRNTMRIDRLGGLEIEGVDRTLDVDLGGDCVYVSTSPTTSDSRGWITLTPEDARTLAAYLSKWAGRGKRTPVEGPD